jgi:hypothetical protein
MATFSIIMEMIPGEAYSRMVEPIEADNIDLAWEAARRRWYNSPLEEQNRKTITRAGGQISVTPQIVDIKEGEYVLPEIMQAPAPEITTPPETEPVSKPEEDSVPQPEAT